MKWIDVNTQLPNFDERVLVAIPDRRHDNVTIGYLDRTEKGAGYETKYFRLTDDDSCSDYTSVTHWMRLPEPPNS